jgi:succinate dehydrogenase / fumarate reductase, membrane anchor subunit
MMPEPGILRSPLGRVRGLGSAKEGTHHWWQQRVTAVALVPLSFWLIYSLLGLSDAGYVEFASWLQNPVNATLMVLTVAMLFHHANLGLQVVLEDYVHGHGTRIVAIMLVKFTCAALAALSIVSVLVVAFKG